MVLSKINFVRSLFISSLACAVLFLAGTASPSWSILAAAKSDRVQFKAMGLSVERMQVQVFALTGQQIFDSGLTPGRQLYWRPQSSASRPLANGVYLYRVLVEQSDGQQLVSIGKLAILRGRPLGNSQITPLSVIGASNPPPGGPATITEYSIPAGLADAHGVAIQTGALSSSRTIFFSVLSGDAIVKLDPVTGDETTFAIPAVAGRPGGYSGITDLRVTPNGKIWFDTGSGDLGVLDPATNTGTMYLTGTGFLDWVHVDQFGYVWAAELGGSNILYLDPGTGAAKTYVTGVGATEPTGLTRRQSGDVWWAERGTGLIGRLDVSGNIITHYTTAFDAIEGIALNPVGNPEGLVWVTPGFEGAPSDGIGSLDPKSGVFTLYTTPTAGSQPYGITIGCAGSVVFGEDGGNQIGVLVPSLGSGTTSSSIASTASVTPTSFTPTAEPFSVTPASSTATMSTGTSTAALASGFSEYPVLSPGGEGPHLTVIGANEKVVYSHIFGNDIIGVLELPPAARCRQQ